MSQLYWHGGNPSNGGSVQLYWNGSPISGPLFSQGDRITVHASPYSGYYFSGFSGDLTGTANDQVVTMNSVKNVTANFASLSTRIVSSPAGATLTVDNTSCTSPCTFQWGAGSSHSLSAGSPQSLSTGVRLLFGNWSDGGAQTHTITVPTNPATYAANFQTQYYLTTASTAGGSVSPQTGWYNSGQTVLVTATPNNGYPFGGFSGGITGNSNPQYVVMTAPTSILANFTSNVLTLAVSQPNVVVPQNGHAVVASYVFTAGDTSGLSFCDTNDPNVFADIYQLAPEIAEIRFHANFAAQIRPVDVACYCIYFTCGVLLPPVDIGVVQVAMKLEQAGVTRINPANNYSEDTDIQITPVDANTGEQLSGWTGTVNIAEQTDTGDTIYTQNGGTLPPTVSITTGAMAFFTIRSLAGPKREGPNGVAPDPAVIITTNYPVYGGDGLQVPQWIISGARIDPHSTGPVYDWFQTRARDVFQSATGDVLTVLNAIQSYSLDGTLTAQCVTTTSRAAQSSFACNPFANSLRINGDGGAVCGNSRTSFFASSFYHEGRHAYQGALSAIPGNDNDGDWLVKNIPVAPTTSFVDSTAPRLVCDTTAFPGSTLILAYHGDSIIDTLGPPDFAGYAREMDAYVFAGSH